MESLEQTGAAPATSAAPEKSAANVRVLTPAQDSATAALSNELVAIAERALEDRLQAEQIVAGLCRMQAALVTTATQSAMAQQRNAAKSELERLVRRAALDAVPPVVTEKPIAQASRKATAPAARKVAPPAVARPDAPTPAAEPAAKRAANPAARPVMSAEPAPAHPAAEAEVGSPSRPTGRRPANRPAGLGDLPSTADLPGATDPRSQAGSQAGRARGTTTPLAAARPPRGRRLALAVVAMIVAVGGLGLGYLASQPDDDTVPGPSAGLPPAPAAPAPSAEAPVAEAITPDALRLEAPDALRLEANEPTAGPLRERVALDAPPGAGSGGASDESSSAEITPAAFGDDDLRIVVHYQNDSPAAALANGLSNSLALSKDPPEVELRPVDFTVATPRIRYFYADDADAAAALAAFLAPPASSNGWQIQNFTHFRPGPAVGTLEVFVPSAGG